MSLVLIVLVGLSGSSACVPLPAQQGRPGQERLIYRMQYGQFHAGSFETGRLPGEDGGVILKASMRTTALYRRFFWADNAYVTYTDAELLPQRLRKEIRQKNLSHTMDITYDHQTQTACTADDRQWQAPRGTKDILSLVYHLRTFPLPEGETRAYTLDGEGLTWELTAENIGREEVNTPAGKAVADRVVLRFAASSSNKWRAWKTDILTNRLSGAATGVTIWFSVAGDRVPMQMIFPASPFDLRMILMRCEGASLASEGR